jgi:hypothetical protein
MPDAQIDLLEGDLCIYACAEIKPWAEPAPADGYIDLVMNFIDKRAFGRPDLE